MRGRIGPFSHWSRQHLTWLIGSPYVISSGENNLSTEPRSLTSPEPRKKPRGASKILPPGPPTNPNTGIRKLSQRECQATASLWRQLPLRIICDFSRKLGRYAEWLLLPLSGSQHWCFGPDVNYSELRSGSRARGRNARS